VAVSNQAQHLENSGVDETRTDELSSSAAAVVIIQPGFMLAKTCELYCKPKPGTNFSSSTY
jgi:hypothetical protein